MHVLPIAENALLYKVVNQHRPFVYAAAAVCVYRVQTDWTGRQAIHLLHSLTHHIHTCTISKCRVS